MEMEVKEFLNFVNLAFEKERDENIRAQWVVLLPYMSTKILKYMSFKEYKDKVTGKNIDRRPASVIMAEIENAHNKANARKEN